MKHFIKKLLREVMVSKIDKWKENTNPIKHGNVTAITTLISKDNENNNKLYLFVGFRIFPEFYEYSYSFILVDENDNALSDGYMTERSEVAPYIPQEIKNKKQIFPLIMDMTRKLMDEQLPQNIRRKTVEPVDGDSLKRYEEITNLMVNEYGYKLISMDTNKWGYTTWDLIRGDVTDANKDMNESYEITHTYTPKEIAKQTFENILPLLKNYDFKPMFECKFPKI